MITVARARDTFWSTRVEGYVLFLDEQLATPELDAIESGYYPHVREILRRHKFEGKRGQLFVLTARNDNRFMQFILVGIGAAKKGVHDIEQLRRATGSAVHELKRLAIPSAVMLLPVQHYPHLSAAEVARQVTMIAHLADYEFITFKSDRAGQQEHHIALELSVTGDTHAIDAAIHAGNVIGTASSTIRHYCDMPPNIATPIYIANAAERMAQMNGLKCTIIDTERAKELGMGGFLSVQSGSENRGRVVILEYKSSVPSAPTIGLVGKGVTFDTGGVSLKPSKSMSGMKYDMSGAAAVLGTLQVVAQLKPAANVIGIMPLVENMPSGSSNRQDDIVTFMNGKTAEIESTDAEGRLILADALCYMEKYYAPDVILDIATLTGACIVALGHFYSALMTRDSKLAQIIECASDVSGERVWRLPFDDDYLPAIKSPVADLANCGKSEYGAGTITAGLFLESFVEKTPWAHIDIAGSDSGVPGVSYLGRGATGVGVRLFVDFINQYIAQHTR